ncbi:MAG: 16S rRNA (adenine(1518)-N(6)/adenine(1519)-N(6))-dimethyltransferase RsmA [Thermoplasmata archaeon]
MKDRIISSEHMTIHVTESAPGKELRRLGIRPSRSMGQNFLTDEAMAEWIVSAASIEPGEKVLEIGPGLGILTRRLAAATDNLVVIELDNRLATNLEGKGISVMRGDALAVNFPEFDKVVSNLPYQISSPIILKLLEHSFKLAILMFQKEFADHLVANPGDAAYSRISVMAGYRSESKIIKHVPKGCFHPVPKVDSAVVEIIPKDPDFKILDEHHFGETVRILFSHKNRKVRNGLIAEHVAVGLGKAEAKELGDILPHNDKRPITLAPAQLAEISNFLFERKVSFSMK